MADPIDPKNNSAGALSDRNGATSPPNSPALATNQPPTASPLVTKVSPKANVPPAPKNQNKSVFFDQNAPSPAEPKKQTFQQVIPSSPPPPKPVPGPASPFPPPSLGPKPEKTSSPPVDFSRQFAPSAKSTTPAPTASVPEPAKPITGIPTTDRKKIPLPLIILLAVILVVGAILGLAKILGKKLSLPQKAVTIAYWGLWEPEPVMSGVIAKFEKEHPHIKVRYSQQNPKYYKNQLVNGLAAGNGPDIFRLHQTWLPAFVSNIAPVPTDVKDSLKMEEKYFPSVKKLIQYNGNYYAIPLMYDGLALYYNQDLLRQVDNRLPKTWWGLQKLANQLTRKKADGRLDIAGVALGTTNNVDHWSDIVGLMILQNGADPADPQSPLVQDALQYYTLFATKDRVWDSTLPNSTQYFAAGKLAFYFGTSWRYFDIKQINPDLKFGITTVPQLPTIRDIDWEKAEAGEVELTNIHWASFWVEAVAAKSAHPKEAWEFLSYLGSEAGLGDLFSLAKEVRDFGEIYPVSSLAQQLAESNPYLSPFVTQAQNAYSWYMCGATHDDTLNEGIITYYRNATNSISQGKTGAEITKTLNDGIQQIIQRYHLPKALP